MDLVALPIIANLRFRDETHHKGDIKGIRRNLWRYLKKLCIDYWEYIWKVDGVGVEKCKSYQYEDE